MLVVKTIARAVRPVRRPAAVPPDQPTLRADLGDCHHQPRVGEWPQVFGNCDVVETGIKSWQFKGRKAALTLSSGLHPAG